ncbi:putative amino-acid import ATP-binding protein YxeO [Variovorax sp. RA8]|nr:putative amino-acid import ATP-binding protein YxeO [Variovorax sp. RA8]
MGPSGSGKTTLIRSLNFLEMPDRGTIRMCGIEIADAGTKPSGDTRRKMREIRKKTAMVFQSFNLFGHMTAVENVIEGMVSVQGIRKASARPRGRPRAAWRGAQGDARPCREGHDDVGCDTRDAVREGCRGPHRLHGGRRDRGRRLSRSFLRTVRKPALERFSWLDRRLIATRSRAGRAPLRRTFSNALGLRALTFPQPTPLLPSFPCTRRPRLSPPINASCVWCVSGTTVRPFASLPAPPLALYDQRHAAFCRDPGPTTLRC